MAGADLKWIQKAMGHSSILVTAGIYAHLFEHELDSVANALDEVAASVTKPEERGQNVASQTETAPKTDGE